MSKGLPYITLDSAEGRDIVLPDVSAEDFAVSMTAAAKAAAASAHERLVAMRKARAAEAVTGRG